jgi:hypothetical protein
MRRPPDPMRQLRATAAAQRRGHRCRRIRLYQVCMHPRSRVVTFLSRRNFRFQHGRVFHQLGRLPERDCLQKLAPDICYTSASYLE